MAVIDCYTPEEIDAVTALMRLSTATTPATGDLDLGRASPTLPPVVSA